MNNEFYEKVKRLNEFGNYLIKEKHLSKITARDYVKRIATICSKEKITLDDLNKNIKKYAYDYTVGEKNEPGNASFNGYRSAIKQYCEFIDAGGTISASSETEPRYRFELCKIPGEHFGIIKLIDTKTDQVIDTETTISKQLHSDLDIKKDVAFKCVNMIVRKVYVNDLAKLIEILGSLDASVVVKGIE